MRTLHIDETNNLAIKEYGSQETYLASIFDVLGGASLKWLWFDPHSKVGAHKAESPQVYIIIEGEGWAIGEQIEPIPLISGDYVYWDKGDRLEVGSDSGMQVLSIESSIPEASIFRIR
ncbi:MAG: hypothetical protein M1281_00650 [Chloroflexi bacterium]|nr:hypothetical protein [Chloroflexota bacterium]